MRFVGDMVAAMGNADAEAGYRDGLAGLVADPGIRDKEAYRGGWLIGRKAWNAQGDGRLPPEATFYIVTLETGAGTQPADPLFRTHDQAEDFARCFEGARVWPVKLER